MRRPWIENPKSRQALKERNTRSDISHFQCSIQNLFWLTRGDALRSAQRLPLAILFRAFGAALFRAFGVALFRALGAALFASLARPYFAPWARPYSRLWRGRTNTLQLYYHSPLLDLPILRVYRCRRFIPTCLPLNQRIRSKGKAMQAQSELDRRSEYVLATGDAAVNRLRIFHNVYGPGARKLLHRAGIKPGMSVVDLGCGTGMVTKLLAELVGPTGEVIGVDYSAAQVEQARALLPSELSNVRFIQASATDTGLPREAFDLVYCRFLLIHLTDPEAALREMRELLKPDGILACEDGDLSSADSEPPSRLREFSNLFGALGPKWGVDYTLGRRLFHLVQAANFSQVEIMINQPVFAAGENKRLLELSVAEAGPSFVAAGLVTQEQLAETVAEMRRLGDDRTVLAIFPRMSQVWARKTFAGSDLDLYLSDIDRR